MYDIEITLRGEERTVNVLTSCLAMGTTAGITAHTPATVTATAASVKYVTSPTILSEI